MLVYLDRDDRVFIEEFLIKNLELFPLKSRLFILSYINIQSFIDGDFCLTYGDGLSDVNIKSLIEFHKNHGKLATLTAVRPPGRFGALDISSDNKVNAFMEKPKGDNSRINGGFFVLSPKIFSYIQGDMSIWEQEPLSNLTKDNQLMAFSHDGFWQPMDTLREKRLLEGLWTDKKAPWKLWD